MHIDPLDSRRFLAGNVNITYPNGGILITGDSVDNDIVIILPISISGDPPFGLAVASGGDTRILYDGVIGNPGDYVTTTFGKSLTINLGDGNDSVYFQGSYDGLVQFGVTNIRTGSGNDTVVGTGSFTSLAIDTNDGNDSIRFLDNMFVTGNLSINTGLGRDQILLDCLVEPGPQIGGKLWIQDTSGPSTVLLKKAYVRKNVLISTGNSLDRITIKNSSFRGAFILGTHGGDDIITLTGSFFRATKDIFAGAGKDTIIP